MKFMKSKSLGLSLFLILVSFYPNPAQAQSSPIGPDPKGCYWYKPSCAPQPICLYPGECMQCTNAPGSPFSGQIPSGGSPEIVCNTNRGSGPTKRPRGSIETVTGTGGGRRNDDMGGLGNMGAPWQGTRGTRPTCVYVTRVKNGQTVTCARCSGEAEVCK